MYVKVPAGGRVTLEDRDNFRAFKLVVEGGSLDDARLALTDLALLPDRDTAWISAKALRQRPEVAKVASRQHSFDPRFVKAKPHVCIAEERGASKAHVEWTAPA